jgi:gluconate kinase
MVIICGTHVTGKETIATALSTSLKCPLLKGELAQSSAAAIARSRGKRGYDSSTVFGQAWFLKMQRVRLMYDVAAGDNNHSRSSGSDSKRHTEEESRPRCIAFVTCLALRKHGRDAIRDIMLTKSIRVIFVVLQITRDTLVGRTVGAENHELEMKILREKAEDLTLPLEEETDVLVVDSMQDIDSLTEDIKEMIKRQVGDVR